MTGSLSCQFPFFSKATALLSPFFLDYAGRHTFGVFVICDSDWCYARTSVGTGGCMVKGELEVRLRLLRLRIRMQPYHWCVHLWYRLLRSWMWLQPHQGCAHSRGIRDLQQRPEKLDCVSILLLPSPKLDKRPIGSLFSSGVPRLTKFKGEHLL